MYSIAQVNLVWFPNKKQTRILSSIKIRVTFQRVNRIYTTRSKQLLSKEEFENPRLKKTKEAFAIAEEDYKVACSICEQLGASFTFPQFKILYDQKVYGKHIVSNKVSFDLLLEEYNREKQCKPNTIESYRTAINWIKKYNPELTIQDTTNEILRSFESYLKNQYRNKYDKDISSNTLGMYMRGLRALFNFAIEKGIITTNPTSKIKIIQTERSKRAVELNDWQKFWSYSPQTDLTHFAYDFTMLSFAMCGANIADILSLKNRSIINEQIHFTRKKTERVDTNVGVPLTDDVKELLKKYGVINSKKPDAYILPFYRENMTEAQQASKRSDVIKRINKGIRIICREIDIEPFTTYNIRHTFAANAAEHKISAEQLMLLLGHKNLKTTQTYLKSITNDLMLKTKDYISSMLNK